MINNRKCAECRNFDRIMVGAADQSRHGRCAAKSIYHHTEGPGQIFPPNVKRAEPDERATPYIVLGSGVEENCFEFTPKE